MHLEKIPPAFSGVEFQLLATESPFASGEDTTCFSSVESQLLASVTESDRHTTAGDKLFSEKLKLHAAKAGGIFSGIQATVLARS